MCLGNMRETEVRVMADPRVQALRTQWEKSEELRLKFMRIPDHNAPEFIEAYSAFLTEWRKFQQMRRELA